MAAPAAAAPAHPLEMAATSPDRAVAMAAILQLFPPDMDPADAPRQRRLLAAIAAFREGSGKLELLLNRAADNAPASHLPDYDDWVLALIEDPTNGDEIRATAVSILARRKARPQLLRVQTMLARGPLVKFHGEFLTLQVTDGLKP
ncbi:MAG: hypothetical protein EXR79_10780 [Myxococcales bacterium]|nr:hypothetical protein [Myxococcales bacterium]